MQVKDYLWIGDDEYHYSSAYYTENRWLDNDTLVVARSKKQEKQSFCIRRISIGT